MGSRIEQQPTCEANASLTSKTSTSSMETPARRTTSGIATDGPMPACNRQTCHDSAIADLPVDFHSFEGGLPEQHACRQRDMLFANGLRQQNGDKNRSVMTGTLTHDLGRHANSGEAAPDAQDGQPPSQRLPPRHQQRRCRAIADLQQQGTWS